MTNQQCQVRSFGSELAELRPLLYRYALRLSGHPSSADDLVQEALARALAARLQFRSGTNLQGWLKTIVRNKYIDSCRDNRRLTQADCERLPAPEADSREPYDVLSVADLTDAVTALGDFDRQLFTLAYQRGLRHRAISEHLGISVNSAGTRLFRVRRKLRVLLHDKVKTRLVRPNVHRDGTRASARKPAA